MKGCRDWSLFSTHGLVLLHLGRAPAVTVREISADLGISPRQVFAALTDLEAAGMIGRTRVGRANHYHVNLDAPFRHPYLASMTLRELLGWLLAGRPQAPVGAAAPRADQR